MSLKKQTAVFHSSTESEIIALEEAVRTEGLQILTFWETVDAILSSQPAAAPTTNTGTRSVHKQTFYRPLPSLAFQTHNRGSLVRGGGSSGSLFSVAGELMEITPFRFDHVENFFAVR